MNGENKVIPLTRYQRDIYFESQKSPLSNQFTLAVAKMLPENFDSSLLKTSIYDVIQQDLTSRLSIVEAGGELYQQILPKGNVHLQELNAEGNSMTSCFDTWSKQVFDLKDGPYIEAAVLTGLPQGQMGLLLRGHHIVCDGSGINLIADKIIQRFLQQSTEKETSFDNTAEYISAVTASQKELSSAVVGTQTSELAEIVNKCDPILFNRKHSTEPTTDRLRFRHILKKQDITDALRQGMTPYQVVMSAVVVLLSRVHNQEQFTVGVPFNNRKNRLNTVGQWANTLPLAISAGADDTFRDLAARIKTDTTTLKKYEHIPLSQLLNALGSDIRKRFDVTVSYNRLPAGKLFKNNIENTNNFAIAHDNDAIAIHMNTYGEYDDVVVDISASVDIFDQDYTFEKMTQSLCRLVDEVIKKPEQKISGTNVFTESEQNQLFNFEQGPEISFSSNETLPSLFDMQARKNGDAIAVHSIGNHPGLTYKDYQNRVQAMTSVLVHHQVRKGDMVAILMDRSPDMLTAIFGTQKAGAAYLPIDPGYPAERIEFMLQDSGVNVIIADTDYINKVSGNFTIINGNNLTDTPDSSAETSLNPDSLAYMIYTSGSTGQPKGVMIEHRSVINRIEWMQERYPLDETDVILQKTPISFDVSVWELFWWSITGASVALLPPGAHKDPKEIINAIRTQKVTTLHFVPSMLQPFLEILEAKPELISELSSLRRVFTSGEALPPARVNQFRQVFSALGNQAPALINLYGPTEATVDVSYFEFLPETQNDRVDCVPIGYPIQNTQLRIISHHGMRQPVGVAGELQIGGIGLARGYHNKPELTAEKFISDEGKRWYKTGDLARWMSDGSIEYLGRIDNQVKIRGNRIELGEIQNTLTQIEGISSAEVIPEKNASDNFHLCAYYVTDGQTFEDNDLRTHLEGFLPEFMVPSKFIAVSHIPVTPNGKADRRALSAMAIANKAEHHQTPKTATESQLANIWQNILKLPAPSTNDNFYALGGDSILMLKVRSELEKAGMPTSLTELSQHLTIAALAKHLDQNERTSISMALRPFELIREEERARLTEYEDAFPATQLQLGLIFHSQQSRNSATYKDVFRYTLKGTWEPALFRQCLASVIQKHPALRSHFNLADFSAPLQVIRHEVNIDDVLDISDLRIFDPHEVEQMICSYMRKKTRFDYKFDQAPLYHIGLFRTAEAIEMVLSFHHAVLDGGSVANLLKELFSRYQNDGLYPEELLPSPALYVRDEIATMQHAESHTFWKSRFDGQSRTQLPNLRMYESYPVDGIFTQKLWVPETTENNLKNIVKQENISAKSIYFAAHCLTIEMISGQDSIATGLVTHGRPDVDGSENMLGLFLNTLPVRFSAKGKTWKECIHTVFQAEQDHAPFRRYPLSTIQSIAGEGAKISTAFNYIHFHVLKDVLNTDALSLESFDPWEETNFELLLNVMKDFTTERTQLRCDFDGSVFSRLQAETYMKAYLAILNHIVSDLNQPATLSRALEPATIDEASPAFASVVSDIAHQMRSNPDAIALSYQDQHWTYEQLWKKSGQIAAGLTAHGTQPNRPVAVALERSPQMIATLLGIMRAGAGCLPLDLSYPPHRIEAMLTQAKPSVVIIEDSAEQPAAAEQSKVISVRELCNVESTFEDSNIKPTQLAYLLFTSGSTGQPKGVAMPHRSLANLVAWQNKSMTGQGVHSTLQYAPLSFDVSFQEIFATLTSGGELILISEAERRDPVQLLRKIEQFSVERIYLPYVALQQLSETAVALNLYPNALKVVISSGEQLRVTEDIRAFIGQLKGGILENQYGPTETHVITSYSMTGEAKDFPALPPIGQAIAHCDVVILNDNLQEVAPGQTGEIYARGAPLAAGYYGQEALTAERFVAISGDDSVLYRTGDLGVELTDGNIICLGRKDAQIKVRGYRVELAEVELAIADTPDSEELIRDVAVVVQQRGDHDHYLAAFLVGEPNDTMKACVQQHLAEVLPKYMIPAQIEWLSELPKTPSGKRDDAALRNMRSLHQSTTVEETPPRDNYERTLCEMAAELLKVPSLSVHQNLFDIGGTSLTAMRLVVLVEKHFGVNIPLSVFVSDPTIAQLAIRVREKDAQPTFSPLVPMRTTGNKRPLFFVHPMGGNVLSYLRLVKYFPQDQPFYALQAYGVDAGSVPLTSVKEQAENYLKTIREIQPHGPYSIGGWSYGGFVSFEMARQLREQGEEVNDLFVLDTVALNTESQGRANDDALLRWFFWELLWLNEGATLPEQFVPEHITTLQERFEYITEHAISTGAIPHGSSRAVVQRLFEVYRTNWKAATDYAVYTADVDMTLLHATRPLPEVLRSMHDAIRSEYRDPKNGWENKTTGELNVIDVPGDHLEIMEEPYVEEVAKVILSEMEKSASKLVANELEEA
ncbi:amino acid adenylation domain-containing protein [Photobacterium sp. 2_MG-2023]|uniref:amino acid adenylation domain-containing protein n=1 Tax=Photobacterium sp. 2_MG-2023 TaxID=3062663 RepID=UPI0026E2E7EB|nr:non-ribosomal peptide synthetase [Photobacterium sp. 2_MG-2023]MDO6581528.1 amino acid adenylation domain-containing protein [Photobacterium sp. 2_MG-2023]